MLYNINVLGNILLLLLTSYITVRLHLIIIDPELKKRKLGKWTHTIQYGTMQKLYSPQNRTAWFFVSLWLLSELLLNLYTYFAEPSEEIKGLGMLIVGLFFIIALYYLWSFATLAFGSSTPPKPKNTKWHLP